MHDLTIFLHIGDAGGTSIARAITAAARPGEVVRCYGTSRAEDAIRRIPPDGRARARYVVGHTAWYGVHRHFPGRPRYVTFLRNPVSRTIAAYFRIRRRPSNPLHGRVAGMSFRQFLDEIPRATNNMTAILGRTDGNAGFVNARFDGALLESAERHLERFWFVGLYESYRADVERLCAALGLDAAGVRPANVRPPEQDEARRALDDAALLYEIGARNLMDGALYAKTLLKRERELADRLRRAGATSAVAASA